MRQHFTHVVYSILLNTLHINLFHLRTYSKSDNILHIICFVSLHAHKVTILGLLTFQMAVWSFRDGLAELEAKNCFNKSMLHSTQGLRTGDIRFVEIQTTFRMHAVLFHSFLQFIKKGCFNPDKLPEDSYSHTTAIILAFIPDPHLIDIKCVGIGNIIWWHRSLLGDMHSIDMVISHIFVVLVTECAKLAPKCRAYMMLIGNYGGHMALTTDPPYCIAYAAEYKFTDDPSRMTFCEPSNHGFMMTASNMVVWRLLSVVNWNPADRKLMTGERLLIPRGMQFGFGLFAELVMPHNHAAPLINSLMCQEVPFWVVGPF